MHALEFLVNGQRVCVAAGSDGMVLSNVTMTGTLSNPDKSCVQFRVGGVRDDHHLEWLRHSLSLGDTVEIRFVDAPQSDPPVKTEPITNSERERLRVASGGNGT